MRHRSLDVVIAVHDSGIRWRAGDVEGDLRKKFYLNRGELPAPICATPPPAGHDPRDCNGDGVFNAPDYDADPRVTDMNGNGVIGAYDLPASGFMPRRSGWRFRDPTGHGSSPHGITKAILRRQRDGTFKVSVSGRDLDLSRYDGTDDRTIAIGLETGNDHGTATAPFRRAGHNLRTP